MKGDFITDTLHVLLGKILLVNLDKTKNKTEIVIALQHVLNHTIINHLTDAEVRRKVRSFQITAYHLE